MIRLVFPVLAVGLLLTRLASPALSEEAAMRVEMTPLKGGLYLLQGRGGNVVASVGDDGVLLVDGDYGEYGQAYRETLAEIAGPQFETVFVLNTHWHGDHTGNNGFWAEQGAVVVAHDNVRARMSTRQEMTARDRIVEASPVEALPVVTFADSLMLHFNGDDIEVLHYPRGHTDGDSVIFYSRENVVHMGDLFFMDVFPFVDIDSGGNVAGLIAAVEAILARVDDDTIIVPGHYGATANRSDLLRYHQMLVSTSQLVLESLGQGMTLEQLIDRGLGERWSNWGKGFISEAIWIRTIAAGQSATPE